MRSDICHGALLMIIKRLLGMAIGIVGMGLCHSALASGTYCAVVTSTPDGFVSLRSGPSTRHRVIYRLAPYEVVLVDTGTCRGDSCSEDRKWQFIESVPRLDGPRNSTGLTQGWINSQLIRQATCIPIPLPQPPQIQRNCVRHESQPGVGR